LRDINIPSGVAHIGSNVFSRCASLEEVRLPASVLELESYAFSDCVSLRKAVLPANNRLLGELLFIGCENLEEIVCMSAVPPPFDCDSPLFDPSERPLYARVRVIVPRRSLLLYRKAPVWQKLRLTPDR
ncbi:MAG: leucine-rich repeat domain-containing protein, partial [Muribaculaceae bacterium]|nr:leucine-rich repeat domain-containing protein [Muribaculaceae bacterium]